MRSTAGTIQAQRFSQAPQAVHAEAFTCSFAYDALSSSLAGGIEEIPTWHGRRWLQESSQA